MGVFEGRLASVEVRSMNLQSLAYFVLGVGGLAWVWLLAYLWAMLS